MRAREDTSRQQAALRDAQERMTLALEDLIAESKLLLRAYRSKRPNRDSTEWASAVRMVMAAEETYDIAALDLAGASGEDV